MITEKQYFDKKREILEEYSRYTDKLAPDFKYYISVGEFEKAFHELCVNEDKSRWKRSLCLFF